MMTERREKPLVLNEETYTPGYATGSVCPRRGSIKLTAPNGNSCIVETNCKTWRCLSCRDRLLNSFKMRVELGCLGLGRSAFITITYRQNESSLKDVASVLKKDWRELWRRWNSTYAQLKWLKVTELTKAGMPHHHLIAGPIPDEQRISCYGKDLEVVRFMRRMASCTCVSHAMSRLWWAITGDSYIVHAEPVLSATRAANYISKYIAKTMHSREPFEAVGIYRRWSSSRGFPGAGRLRLAQTDRTGWQRLEYQHGALNFGWTAKELSAPYLLERNGEDLRMRLTDQKSTQRAIGKLRRLIDVN